jgi:hypothetical protein
MDALEQKAVELYAMYGIPSSVFKQMRDEYGENSLSAGQIRRIREKYRKEILEKRREISAKIPLLDLEERWAVLQQIVDGSLEGDPVFNKDGIHVGDKPDRSTALNALKLAHELTQPKGAINDEDDELIRSIVVEAYDDLKSKNPAKTNAELLAQMLDELPDNAKPFIEEIKLEQVENVG